MSIWKIFETTILSTTAKVAETAALNREELPVPTIVITPVLEEREEYLELGYQLAPETPAATIEIAEVTPTPPTSSSLDDENTKGLGISGVPISASGTEYDDPLSEVDDLLAILGLDLEAEKEEVEDEIEVILEGLANTEAILLASKLVEKSRCLFLELSKEWKGVAEKEYLPAKREAQMVIWESYAMEEFKKPDAKARVQISQDEKLFAAIVLADVATPEVKAAMVAAEKIFNLQALALQKYATRLKDHKILPLASYRRYVRRVKRFERELEGWRAKEKACKRILVVGEKVLKEMTKQPGSPDSGYGE